MKNDIAVGESFRMSVIVDGKKKIYTQKIKRKDSENESKRDNNSD